MEALAHRLGPLSLLIVLDNLEQITEAGPLHRGALRTPHNGEVPRHQPGAFASADGARVHGRAADRAPLRCGARPTGDRSLLGATSVRRPGPGHLSRLSGHARLRCRYSHRSVAAWTDCRSRSSWPPRAPVACRCRSCWTGWITACRFSSGVPTTCQRGSARYGPRSPGVTTCCRPPSSSSSPGSPFSPADARWSPRRRCAGRIFP